MLDANTAASKEIQSNLGNINNGGHLGGLQGDGDDVDAANQHDNLHFEHRKYHIK